MKIPPRSVIKALESHRFHKSDMIYYSAKYGSLRKGSTTKSSLKKVLNYVNHLSCEDVASFDYWRKSTYGS